MKNILLYLTLAIACSGCFPYNGVKYPRTSKIDVYSYVGQIPPDYIELGEFDTHTAGGFYSRDYLLDVLKEDAMDVGADGIIRVRYEGFEPYGSINKANHKARAVFIKYKKNIPADSTNH